MTKRRAIPADVLGEAEVKRQRLVGDGSGAAVPADAAGVAVSHEALAVDKGAADVANGSFVVVHTLAAEGGKPGELGAAAVVAAVDGGVGAPSVEMTSSIGLVAGVPADLQMSGVAHSAAALHPASPDDPIVAGTAPDEASNAAALAAAAEVVGDAEIANAAAAAAAAADAAAVVVAPNMVPGNPPMLDAAGAAHLIAAAPHAPHPDGRPRPFLCNTCGKGFLRTGDKNRHIKTVHEKLRKAICAICGGHVSPFPLVRAGVAADVACFLCWALTVWRTLSPLQFGHKGDLGRHITRVHEKGEFRQCTTCGATFQSNAAFNAHLKIHEKRTGSDKPFRCSHCRKVFETDASRKAHEEDVHYVCKLACDADENCREKFPSARSLKAHIQKFHTKVLKCAECPATFRLADELTAHVGKRHREAPAGEPAPAL
jgi:uncharacterized C2H2 Zn-finger protein